MTIRLKHLILPLILLLASCGKHAQTADFDDVAFDSIAIDTVARLSQDANAPQCQLSIHLQYAKGENAQAINKAVLQSEILVPDYSVTQAQPSDFKQAAQQFVSEFTAGYLKEYGELYRTDTEHAFSYNLAYQINTATSNGPKDILNYIATVKTDAGGAYPITQTIVKNINVKIGAIVGLDDLFKPGYETALKEKLEAALLKRFEAENMAQLAEKSIFVNGIEYISENFILGKNDITFIYCEAEAAPHDVGEIRLKIDNDDIEDLLK